MDKWKIFIETILKYKSQSLIIVDNEAKVQYLRDDQGIIFETDPKYAVGKSILDIFSHMTKERSTLYKVLEDEIPRINEIQSFYTYKENKITSITTTLPLYEKGKIIGGLEIFEDINNYEKISKNIIEAQKEEQNKEIVIEEYKDNGTVYTLNDIIGESQEIKDIKKKILKISDSSSSVLIQGETGTGKELVAQSLHNSSFNRRKNPFIAQNCAAIPKDLLEGILFGTTSGSFTGAREKPGLFELADGGTLFLDEINSMDVNLQAKLLRVLQEGVIRRVGGRESKKIDVRIVTATNISPEIAMERGMMRKDLYYRLNVLSIRVPPLRKRREDIPVLVDYFIKAYNNTLRKNIKNIDRSVCDKFKKYPWPGNVRELKYTIENIMNFTEDTKINVSELPEKIKNYNNIPEKNTSGLERITNNNNQDKEKVENPKLTMEKIPPLNNVIEEIERKFIVKALRKTDGNKSAAARLLKIPRQTLNNKIKKYEIKEKYEAK
ncbi:MAG: sigma 54-interacting transcriptional regulator [Eubacteriales bacterium]